MSDLLKDNQDLSPDNLYNNLVARHKAYGWGAPLPREEWVRLWYPSVLKNAQERRAAGLDRPLRMRFVITKVTRDGLRVLATTNQGRHHHDTRREAEQQLAAILSSNSADTLLYVYGDVTKMRVDEVECYDHGDATRTVFGEE